jgi:DNA-binding response OmpR family regulator
MTERAEQDWHAIVADDDDDWRGLVSRTFRRAGVDVLEARDGAELLALCRAMRATTRRFLVVVTDLDMPRCDGITAAMALRCIAPTMPILMVTGVDDRSTHLQAFGAGANLVLTKPLSPGAVLTAMRELLPAAT